MTRLVTIIHLFLSATTGTGLKASTKTMEINNGTEYAVIANIYTKQWRRWMTQANKWGNGQQQINLHFWMEIFQVNLPDPIQLYF